MLPHLRLANAAALFAALSLCGTSHAESGLRLKAPSEFGERPAWTYDDAHQRVGEAKLAVRKLENGQLEASVTSAIRGGARMHASAILAPIPGSDTYRPIRQRSLSYDEDGNALELLRVDHIERTATCTPDAGEGKPKVVLLPRTDRVANVLLPFVFQPLARGETSEANFQIFLCGNSGPRVVDMHADVRRREHTFAYEGVQPEQKRSAGFVEIQYWPELFLVPRNLLPSFSFWLDMDGDYLAHRIPLYSDGPEVLVARRGWEPDTLEPRR